MTTITFTNLNDTTDTSSASYTGSLRAAIASAASGDTIKPDETLSGGTISLAAIISVTGKRIVLDGSELDEKITLDGGSGWDGDFTSLPSSGCCGISFAYFESYSEVHNFKFSHCYGSGVSGSCGNGGRYFNCDFSYSAAVPSGSTGGAGAVASYGGVYNCNFDYCYGRIGGAFSGSTAINCTFTNFYCAYYGSAVFCQNLINCFFNTKTDSTIYGTARLNYNGGVIKDTLIKGSALAFSNVSGGYVLNVENCTFIGCDEIAGWCTPTIKNTLYSGTLAGTSAGTITTLSCYEYQTTDATAENYAGKVFVDYDNGDYNLKSDSPAVGAGNNNYVTTTTDLAGNPRIVGTVDCGAYEWQPPALSTPTIAVDSVGAFTAVLSGLTNADASGWALITDSGTAATITPTSAGKYTTAPLTQGTHTFKVKAVGDGISHADSAYSNTVSAPLNSAVMVAWEGEAVPAKARLRKQDFLFRASIKDYKTSSPIPPSIVTACTLTVYSVVKTDYTGTTVSRSVVSGWNAVSVPTSAFTDPDSDGFNFNHVPDQTTTKLFASAGTYEVEYNATTTEYNPITLIYQVTIYD